MDSVHFFKCTPLDICHFSDEKLLHDRDCEFLNRSSGRWKWPPIIIRNVYTKIFFFYPFSSPNLDCAKYKIHLGNGRCIFAAGFWLFFHKSLLWNDTYNADSSWLKAMDGGWLASTLTTKLLRMQSWKGIPLPLFLVKNCTRSLGISFTNQRSVDWICSVRIKTF